MKLTRFRFYLITFVCLFIIVNTLRSMGDLIRASGRLGEAQKKLEEAQVERARLKKEKNWVESDQFAEEQARNQLGMSRPGETVIVLPERLQKPGLKVNASELPNWKKWWQLLF